MRRAGYVALALVVGGAVVALLVYAAGPDTYYTEGVSRWEHSRGYGGWVWFGVSIGLGLASFAGLVVRACGLAQRFGGVVLGMTLAALLSFPVAWVAISAGH
jgi:hypothetical protein